MTTLASPSLHNANKRVYLTLALAVVLWLIAYTLIQPLADWISYSVLGLPEGSRLGEAVAFFLYDVPKILLLLSGIEAKVPDTISETRSVDMEFHYADSFGNTVTPKRTSASCTTQSPGTRRSSAVPTRWKPPGA